MTTLLCNRCGGAYDEIFFHSAKPKLRNTRISKNYHRRICIGCKQKERDAKKRSNRARNKAVNTRDRHARKLGYSIVALEDLGWNLDDMEHDIEHVYDNQCPSCHAPFAEMASGLSDLTLDIRDPSGTPYYGANTQWICSTCNSAKRDLSPEEWGLLQMQWRLWEQQTGIRQLDLGF